MKPTPVPDYDKDFLLLNTIDSNSHISQRDISHRTGLSLGTVNLLLQKMIRDGLVKMETIPANRVIYVLTPQGMAEKAEKTVRYLRLHYQAIFNTKERIWRKLDLYSQTYAEMVICLPKGELKDLLKMAVREYVHQHPGIQVKMVESKDLEKYCRSTLLGSFYICQKNSETLQNQYKRLGIRPIYLYRNGDDLS